MKFSRIGEPLGSRYRMVKEGLAGQNSAYLDAVVRVLGQPSFGNDRRKNELAYMSLAAMYLYVEVAHTWLGSYGGRSRSLRG